ncbi:restriction endonuclease subunit S [uncultured Holdemanella sp.]|uniref:restriction endonuclease subunit S n=1 Tax=uncultured Holdemanella sp. TaxID=1763549 RepID=UPI0025E48159|nr:restriction endonuclease subunit S [uncultured Holdemanella sp.]
MKIKLIDICSPKQWKTIPTDELLDDGYPVYGANGLIGYSNVYNHKDSVIAITCRGASCGSVNITPPFSYVTGNAMCLDEVKHNIDINYLYYFLKNYNFKNIISGSAQPQITRQGLNKVYVRYYSSTKQKQIVSRLKCISTIIELKKIELNKFDDLIKARFIEMFGRPFINNLNWESKQIKNVVNEVKYGTSKPSVENGEYKYLRMNNLTYDGRFDLTDLKFISLDNDELEKCVVRKGDVLFNRTNSLDLIGKTAEFDFNEDMVIAGYIIRIRLKETIVPKFFSMYMNTDEMKLHLRTIAKGAVNQANINAQELQEIPIYLPPIELQNQFVNFVRQVDKSRFDIKKSIIELEREVVYD